MKKNIFDSSPNGGSRAEHLEHALQEINVDQLARQTRFCRRQPRKLSPLLFLHSCFLVLLQPRASLRHWAMLIGVVGNQTYAKQSLFKRLTPAALGFVQQVLQALLLGLSLGAKRVLPPALASFNRVLLHDSVILSLSPKLARAFPGTGNQFGPRRGMLRVQAWLDLKHEQFVRFTHGPYNRNDLKAAPEGLEELQANDLLIRDLGYCVLEVLRRLQELKVFFLSRLRTDASLFEPGGQPLDLRRALRGRDSLDQPVLVGGQGKTARAAGGPEGATGGGGTAAAQGAPKTPLSSHPAPPLSFGLEPLHHQCRPLHLVGAGGGPRVWLALAH